MQVQSTEAAAAGGTKVGAPGAVAGFKHESLLSSFS